jgi:putative ABC transport system permease protein
MEIGPVFRALFHTRSRFWLITIEIALTLAVVVNCVALIRDTREELVKPTGLDLENLLVLYSRPFGDRFEDETYVEQSMEQDLRTLRALPGVLAATSISAVPLSGSGSSTGRRATGSELQSTGAPYFLVASDALATLGVELEAGRDLSPDDEPPESPAGAEPPRPERHNVLLTR